MAFQAVPNSHGSATMVVSRDLTGEAHGPGITALAAAAQRPAQIRPLASWIEIGILVEPMVIGNLTGLVTRSVPVLLARR